MFWRFISGRSGGRNDIVQLGALLLRRLHRLPRPTMFDLPEEDILGRARRRIDAASVSPAIRNCAATATILRYAMTTERYCLIQPNWPCT